MDESVTEERSVRGYVSCIKINGKPILPPLMTPERWVEMKRYKEMAVSIEASLNMKRNSVDSGVICPSRSSSLANRKPVDIVKNTISKNVHSTSDEEALSEQERKCTSPVTANNFKEQDSKIVTVSNNAEKAETCKKEIVENSQFTLESLTSVDNKVSEAHCVTIQGNITEELDKINLSTAHVSETIPTPKDNICKGSFDHSEKENLLLLSKMETQEQILQSEAKHVCSKTTGSVLPSSCLQDTMNFGTISSVHVPAIEVTNPITESSPSTKCSSHSKDEARIPVKKIQASLNILEIMAQDDIIQDGLGFKVWKQSSEMLKRKPQHSSTPVDTTQENLSTTETNRIENLDESESSILATTSTDLNNYMNTSGSSKSTASSQSLSSFAPAVYESEIVKQTSHDSHQSSLNDQNKHLQIEIKAQRSFSKSIPESQLQNLADNLVIDGIRPLDLENEVGRLTTPDVGVIKTSATSEVETVIKVKDHVKEKTSDSIESTESKTSSGSPTPKLRRQNSYVLECPSPLLVEYYKSLNDGDMTASPTKKTLSSSENQQEDQKRTSNGSTFNSSLPNSSVTSPVRLQSSFASSDCLSSSKENIRTSNSAMSKPMLRKNCSSSRENFRKSRCISSQTVRRLSADETHSRGRKSMQKISLVPSPRCGSVDNISTAVSQKSSKIAMKCPRTPHKTPRTPSASMQNLTPSNSVKHIPYVSQNRNHVTGSFIHEPIPSSVPEKRSAQEELRIVFLRLQTEHQQQMAQLLEKQKREQEAMREAFRLQEIKLMTEIRNVCPEVFSTPESHKLLSKSFMQPLNRDVAVGVKESDHDKMSPNNSTLENMTGDLQESMRQDEENPKVDKNFVNKKMKNNDSPRLHGNEVFSELQNMNTSTSEVAETLISSNMNLLQEACQNQTNCSSGTAHVDFSNFDSSIHRNNVIQEAKEHAFHQLQNIHNNTSSSDIEAVARENINSSEISSNKSHLSRSMTTESSVSNEYSDSIVTSGASDNKITQQMLCTVSANGTKHHLDEISHSGVQSINTITSDVSEISKQVCRRRPSWSATKDDVMFLDTAFASVVSDMNENKATQQELYGLQTDGKIVSSMLTVAKSEVIVSNGLPYFEPTEGTLRTTVFTQLNGVDHSKLVNTHISTVMHGARQSCSRELFPVCSRFIANYTKTHERAAIRIQSVIRGYLTRRLFRTARVQDLITTIRDTLLCAVQVSQECWPDVQPEDVALHRRLIQQVTAACYALHDVFFSLHISEQMAIIAADRQRLRNATSRTLLHRPLSAATRRVLERKMKQNENEGKPRPVRTRRTWSSDCDYPSGSYGIARSCLLRQQQQQMSSSEQMVVRTRYSGSGSRRRPWR